VRIVAVAISLALAACSTSPDSKQANKGPAEPPGAATTESKNPIAKYLEIDGFRLAEDKPGMLKVTFAVCNHSEADIGDLVLKVRLRTTASKPGDPPVTEFDAKVPNLGPQELKDVTATAPTKLRIYELPDWQFLRADFDVLAPPPPQ